MKKFHTRLGDGYNIEMRESEIKMDLEDGTRDASEGVSPTLAEDDLKT